MAHRIMLMFRPKLWLAVAFATATMGCPTGLLPTSPVDVTNDVEYGLGYVRDNSKAKYTLVPLYMDVYRPANEGEPKPGVIVMHGGGFIEGGRGDERIVEFAKYFAARGYVVFAIDYRLLQDNPPAPDLWGSLLFPAVVHAAIVDAKAAVRHVRANADAYGVDPDNIAFIGESAGAIAGVAVAMTNADQYSADGDDFPIPQQNEPNESARVQAYVHLWGNADHVLTAVSSDDPPTMILHGEEDDVILTPYSAAERLHFALELRGVPHEFYAAEGFGHAAWNYRLRAKSLERLTLVFLNQHLLGIEKSTTPVE